ncbi:DUF1540 domain-containing protein [Nocardioides mangrovicus]|uniref:DUF1540 domain-containing protein n=1 Tax=Nocardioides mangrovicus TaxID=2478913 RepID=A0A3L8P7M7_9ACTN|nr:DUF1540 domain-containing protein [Nocardioides mangrovicus]RLV51215.1 DUF1540 domain-containing protein [Nocardioides mangrovicus]
MTQLPVISTCSVEGCSYNHDHDCHAGAITVTGDHSACGTYIHTDSPAGNDTTAQVGACHRADCVHNESLECHAESIEIGAGDDPADCLTYAASA